MSRRLMHVLRESASPVQSMSGILVTAFAFNLAVTGWTAVVAGRFIQGGGALASLGGLFAVCEIVRMPALLLLPVVMLRFGARRLTQAGLLALASLPLLAAANPSGLDLAITLPLSAIPVTAVYAGLPAFAVGAVGGGRDGRALALLALTGGAGGGIGPWVGGWLADGFGPIPVLVLACAICGLLVPAVRSSRLPPPSPWPGWASLARRSPPWQALLVLVFASAGDGARTALVPAELIHSGLTLGDVGFLIGIGSALVGVGFLALGYVADRHAPSSMVRLGLTLLAIAAAVAAWTAGPSLVFAILAAAVGLGANGATLGAELLLIGWIGRDRTAVAMAVGALAVLGGRMVGAPIFGAVADLRGEPAALGLIALVSLALCALTLIVLSPRQVRCVGAANG